MPDLISLLGQSANGLSVFRAATATAGHNIQNANNPGYARQRVEPETQSAEFFRHGAYLGRGVMLGGITQSRDAFLERQIPAALGAASQHSAEADALAALNVLDPDLGSSVGTSMSSFFSSLRELAQNPSDASLRTVVVGTARSLARNFNTTASTIEAARTGIDASVATDVDEASQVAGKLARLNVQIAVARGRGAEPNDLLDERFRARDRLAELTGAVAVPDDRGNISMVLPSGMALVSGGEAARLSTIADATNGGHLAVQVTRIGATVPDTFAGTALGGRIRGHLDARDSGLLQAKNAVDTLAFDMASALNGQHRQGFALDGSAGQDVFVLGATSADAARDIQVNGALAGNPSLIAAASSVATLPGDASNLQALIAVETQTLSGGADAFGSLAKLVADFGLHARSAEAMAEQDKGIADHLNGLRESISGVSIDEEMIAMTQAQRAFEALSKVISVTDGLLGTLMELK